MNSVTAIIPTLTNTQGLKHLLKELDAAAVPAVVVDNQPDSQKSSLKCTTYLPQSKNLFFAAAVNLGAKSVNTEWILILNDDIEGVSPDKLQKLIDFANQHSFIAVSPVLRSPKGHVENIGYTVLPIGRAELNFDTTKNTSQELDGLTAACLLMKRDVFETIGGFDESFVAYLEDVDLFLRLKRSGYTFGVDTSIEVFHNHMTTSSKMKGFKQKRDMINWWKIIWKNWDKKVLVYRCLPIMIERLKNVSGFIKVRYVE